VEDFLTVLGLLIVFAAVLFLAWLTTKVLGKRMAGSVKNKNMRIVETLPIGMDRCLYLIRVGKKYFLFHGSRKSLEMVSEIELDDEAIENLENAPENTKVFDFKRIFDSYSGLIRDKTTNSQDVEAESADEAQKEKPGTILGNIKKLQRLTQGKEYKG
jgi:flagellar protein FliO/FliZ